MQVGEIGAGGQGGVGALCVGDGDVFGKGSAFPGDFTAGGDDGREWPSKMIWSFPPMALQ